MVRSSISNQLSRINQIDQSDYIPNPDRTITHKFSLAKGGRKGKPVKLPVRKVGGFCSEFQVPCSELEKLRHRTKNTELETNQSTAEASRSCEVLMETKLETQDRKATKGGL